jgi:hypothetical protein
LNGSFIQVEPPRSFLYNRALTPFPLVTVGKGVSDVTIHLIDEQSKSEVNSVENIRVKVENGLACFLGTRLGKVTSNQGKQMPITQFYFLFRLWSESDTLILEHASHSFMIFSKPYLRAKTNDLRECFVEEVIPDFGIIGHQNVVVLNGKFPKSSPIVRFGSDTATLIKYGPRQLIAMTPKYSHPCVVPIFVDELDSEKKYNFRTSCEL